jgi:hypothetical protein
MTPADLGARAELLVDKHAAYIKGFARIWEARGPLSRALTQPRGARAARESAATPGVPAGGPSPPPPLPTATPGPTSLAAAAAAATARRPTASRPSPPSTFG